MLVIRHAAAYTPEGVLHDGAVQVVNGHIAAVGPQQSGDTVSLELDGTGLLLIPGLVDLQCNGLGGFDVLAGETQELLELSMALARFGCTAVLPTIVSAPHDVLTHALQAIATAMRQPVAGASILGAHLEGPWLSPHYVGAHDPACVRPFTPAELSALLDAAQGCLRLVTVAPEAPGNDEAVERLVSAGVLVSLGHSAATYEQAKRAVEQGARMATHCFNAMAPLHHRSPGLAGAALDLPQLIPGIIPDGHHLHPAVVRLLARARGPQHLVVVTDSVRAAGTPPAVYAWHGRHVHWDGETVRLSSGGLAGSGLTPIEALRRFVALTGLSLEHALPSMTSTPARLLGMEQTIGAIVPGARADLVLVTPDLQVKATLVAGRIVYQA